MTAWRTGIPEHSPCPPRVQSLEHQGMAPTMIELGWVSCIGGGCGFYQPGAEKASWVSMSGLNRSLGKMAEGPLEKRIKYGKMLGEKKSHQVPEMDSLEDVSMLCLGASLSLWEWFSRQNE